MRKALARPDTERSRLHAVVRNIRVEHNFNPGISKTAKFCAGITKYVNIIRHPSEDGQYHRYRKILSLQKAA